MDVAGARERRFANFRVFEKLFMVLPNFRFQMFLTPTDGF
jgi:hypothetical protein